MKCKDWKIKISAFLDGALDEAESSKVISHIESCPECRSFNQEHSALNALFSARAADAAPSPFTWNKIERRITSGAEEAPRQSFLDYLRMPRLAYGLASAMVLISLAALVQLRGPSSEELQLLAEMDAFTIEAQGNPFIDMTSTDSSNPFFSYAAKSVNPFDSNVKADK